MTDDVTNIQEFFLAPGALLQPLTLREDMDVVTIHHGKSSAKNTKVPFFQAKLRGNPWVEGRQVVVGLSYLHGQRLSGAPLTGAVGKYT